MVVIKSARQLAIMAEAGQMLGKLFVLLGELIKPGMTTAEIDAYIEDYIRAHQGEPTFKGYQQFPNASCISVNQEIIHGIPGPRVLKAGDLVSVDIGITYRALIVDAARTYPVGAISKEAEKLLQVTKEALQLAIDQCQVGRHIGDLGNAIATRVRQAGYCCPEDYTGHGVGKALHEDPAIPNRGTPGTGVSLKAGMTLAIEPMVIASSDHRTTTNGSWTVISRSGALAAHFEETVAITVSGPVVLTKEVG